LHEFYKNYSGFKYFT